MPNRHQADGAEQALCTPAFAMERLQVSRNTLLRWEEAGRLTPIRLPSGHRRYRLQQIEAISRGEVPA